MFGDPNVRSSRQDRRRRYARLNQMTMLRAFILLPRSESTTGCEGSDVPRSSGQSLAKIGMKRD